MKGRTGHHSHHSSKHKHRALGGRSSQKDGHEVTYAGAGSHVEHEAKERKRGGKAVHMHGHHAKHHMGKRASGGRAMADKSPFVSSAHVKPAGHMKEPQGG